MATIRASCATCGDVELTTKDVNVQVCSNTSEGSYSFRCPVCRMQVSKAAEPRIIDLLVSSGVRMHVWHLPAELAEPRTGAPISYDDVLEFHFLLQQPDLFDRINSPARGDRRGSGERTWENVAD